MRFAGTQLSNFMGDTTDFSQIAGASQRGRSMERRAVMQGEGMVGNAGVQSLGKMKSAEAQASAIEAGGQAQAQASMASGIGSMFSGLASGISTRFGNNSGARKYGFDPAGSQGNPLGIGPRVREGGY